MNKLRVNLKNCYGIQSLDAEFDFTSPQSIAKAYTLALARVVAVHKLRVLLHALPLNLRIFN
jgi:hypothetical protein